MPRQARQASGTGIYHVMMRGINHQNIFEEQEDYYQFLNTLDMMALSYEPDGTPSGRTASAIPTARGRNSYMGYGQRC